MPATNTTPVFSAATAPLAAQYVATATMTTRTTTLDLRGKFGAWIYVRIGRHAVTVLNTAAKVIVRPAYSNDAVIHPSSPEFTSSVVVATASSTLSGATAIADTTITLASGTGFAAGDAICIHSDDTSGLRIEFAEVFSVSGAVLTLTAPLKLAHNNADRVVNGADIFARRWVAGGDVIVVRGLNYSNQNLLMEVLAETYDSDTTV